MKLEVDPAHILYSHYQLSHISAGFQPIVSIKKRSIIGFEGLCYGIAKSGDCIPPTVLFQEAADKGKSLELDRLCRTAVFEAFSEICNTNPDYMLFVNLDASVIVEGVVGSYQILDTLTRLNLNPKSIVIEINEILIKDIDALQRFVSIYKEFGCLIAMDDVGTGYSGLSRILELRPDILKIDRSLVTDIHKEYYKQVVFSSILNMAKKIGALVVAEGIETLEEAMTALELGADILQGFYFAKRLNQTSMDLSECNDRIIETASAFRNHMIERARLTKSLHSRYESLARKLVTKLTALNKTAYGEYLIESIPVFPQVECMYILDANGIQITETVGVFTSTATNPLYSPAKIGTDHSLKDYFYLPIYTNTVRFTTEPYISLASGNICVTVSNFFHNLSGERHILCIDVKPDWIV